MYSLLKYLVLLSILVGIFIPIYYQSSDINHIKYRLIHHYLTYKHRFFPITTDTRHVSTEYRAFEELLELYPLVSIDSRITDPLEIVKSLRQSYQLSTYIPRSLSCSLEKQQYTYGGRSVDTYWINRGAISNNKNFILYLHGGGYVFGDIDSHNGFECYVSEYFKLPLLHVEYRLGPEYRLPTAVDDTMTVYQSLLEEGKYTSENIVCMGDSAGGGLVLLTIQSLIKQHLPVPRGIILLSPWSDLTLNGESYEKNRHIDKMLPIDVLRFLVSQAVENQSDIINYSPAYHSFGQFPSMYLCAGTGEVLESDTRSVYKKAKEKNIDLTIELGQYMMHIYPLFYLYAPESQQTLKNIREWVNIKFQGN
ncbi:unnamed protein product [Didymodactylos carnosus]|uniref:Alpha/beta hydrolase fold-3 domain-containing protein n=1 Tax=Didymodactylos carnosus TaxID=1234261 RepID=A0A8S2CWE6_9BILA|nr:unnamed protein product [Didymodactylos carnosus]CAF3530831.1 unnamed protein product [Didymodactylos carnosus]